jgi:hypothetical protein
MIKIDELMDQLNMNKNQTFSEFLNKQLSRCTLIFKAEIPLMAMMMEPTLIVPFLSAGVFGRTLEINAGDPI